MNLLALLGLEGLAARWRANVIEGAIAVEDRLELAGMEWADQKKRLMMLAVLGIIAGGLTVIALIMLSLAILVTYWDSPNRTEVAWWVAGFWGILWIGVLASLVSIGKRAGNAFALTRNVLSQDWQNVKDRL